MSTTANAQGANRRSIRRNLIRIVLLALLPMGLFAAGLFYTIWQNQQEQFSFQQIARARTFAQLVESEINSTIERLELLGSDPLLTPATMQQFHVRLQKLLPENRDWANVLVLTPEAQVANARQPWGAPLPRLGDRPYQHEAFITGKPTVSDLFTARTVNIDTLDVAVPVKRDGRVAYLFLVPLKREYIGDLFRKRIGPDTVVSLVDRNLRIVARSANESTTLGRPAADDFAAKLRAAPEGTTRSRLREGTAVRSSWTRLNNGWIIVVNDAAAQNDLAFLRYFGLLVLIWLTMLLAGLVMARVLWRGIERSIGTTVEVASRLAAGEQAKFPDSTFGELQNMAGAIDTLFTQERRARGEAEAANKAKDEFLAMLGHELRNPIGAIANAAHILSLPPNAGRNERADEVARAVVLRQTEILKRLIDDLLDMGRVLTGKIALEKRPMDLSLCVRQVVETFAAAGRSTRHRLTVHTGHIWVDGDPTRLDQVLTNILSNALAHTPPGGNIAVELRHERGEAVLTITDTGAGITADALPRVFDLFFQDEQRADRPRSGLGIGLTLVQRLVVLHGGSVAAASAGAGKGATFTVRLPSIEQPVAAPETLPQPPAAGRRILVVDDNKDARETLATVLELDGHLIVQAADGPEALARLAGFHADAAIIDIGLPGMDGYEVARTIRGNPQAGKPPVLIALTGYGLPEDQRRAKEAGFDVHMVKPADFDKLLKIIETA